MNEDISAKIGSHPKKNRTKVIVRSRNVKTAPNIAIIKYWGKENEEDIIPINPSVSFSMPFELGYTETYTELLDDDKEKDCIILNGEKIPLQNNKRYLRIVTFIRNIYKIYHSESKEHNLDKYRVKIVSNNSFPTACGLSSSSSGSLALVLSLIDAFGIKFNEIIEDYKLNFGPYYKPSKSVININDMIISGLARIGSGSACRGLYPLSYWDNFMVTITKLKNFGTCDSYLGEKEHGQIENELLKEINILTKSFSIPITTNLLNDLSVIVITVNKNKKKVSSTIGMRQTVLSSVLFTGCDGTLEQPEASEDDLMVHSLAKNDDDENQKWKRKIETVEKSKYLRARIARQRLNILIKLLKSYETNIEERENLLSEFFEVIMKDAMTFHALCLDTYPPVFYLNSASFEIINIIQEFNKEIGKNVAGYTFDAGPNGVVFCMKRYCKRLEEKLKEIDGILSIVSGSINLEPYVYE